MAFELPNLPFSYDSLAPNISRETLEYHHDKHHSTYIKKLNGLIKGSDDENKTLEALVKNSSGGVFNNAAQAWNHEFYWNCLCDDSKEPSLELKSAIEKEFESFQRFRDEFIDTTATLFGSGWSWLTLDDKGKLAIEKSCNANNPLREGRAPLLTCDMWEHAYYIDYRNDKVAYLNAFWEKINWEFVSQNYSYAKNNLDYLSAPCKDSSPVCEYVDNLQSQETSQT
ncbi:MAG: superoxide dismutase [Campylobacterales bacterium]